MKLFNIYSDDYNYRIPYKHEDKSIYIFRSFKSKQDWKIVVKKYSDDNISLFFNDDTKSDFCNNLTMLTKHPMTKKHRHSLIRFILEEMFSLIL